MSPQEKAEAMEISRRNSEIAMTGLIEMIKAKFPLAKADYFGRAESESVKLEIVIDSGDPFFNDISGTCRELEDSISYPEVSITLRPHLH